MDVQKNSMDRRAVSRQRKRSGVSCLFVLVWLAAVVVVISLSGWALLATARSQSPDGNPLGGLGVGAEFNEYPHWQGQERVNILVLGLDQREQEGGAWRTDTMLVVSVDPLSHRAGLLSIPRDLWVDIPDYGPNRINAAYTLGETNAYPGGGPALAKKSVQSILGEPIHYYVQLNFGAAVQLVDLIGGVDVYVEQEINDPLYPDEAYGYDPLYIPAGWQHMDGALALKYARSRHGSSDFDRARRQQQLIMAVREKVLQLDMLTNLLPRAREAVVTLGGALQSDLTFDQVIRLAQLAAEIDAGSIRPAVIDSTMTQDWVAPNGAQVLLPNRERMATLHALIFSPPDQANGQTDPLAAEAAQVLVQNGTLQPGLAAQCAERLRVEGFQIANVTNAVRQDYSNTLILVYTGKWSTAWALAATLGLPHSAVTSGSNPEGLYDLKLILGTDYASSVAQP